MSTRQADRPYSVYPIIGFGFLSLGVRIDVMYTPTPTPRGRPDTPGGIPSGTPRTWCVHWSLAAGSWQNGGSVCPWIEERYERVKTWFNRPGKNGGPK